MLPIQLINAGYFVQSERYRAVRTPLRTVKYFEFELIQTECATGYIDGCAYPHRKGNVVIACPGQLRQTAGVFETYYLRLECLDPAFRSAYLDPLPQIMAPLNTSEREAHFQTVIDAYADGTPFRELEMYGRILELIGQLNQTRGLRLDRASLQLDQARTFIQTHYSEPLTLDRIAATAAFSPSYFHARFRDAFGCTPADFLRNTRLSAAKKMLLTTDRSITEISADCGFESAAYFARVFREHVGMSPSAFRKTETVCLG